MLRNVGTGKSNFSNQVYFMIISSRIHSPFSFYSHLFDPQSKSEAVVVSYLVFIKQHCISSQEYADIALPVLTNKGLLCPEQSGVHFSEAYDNMDLSETLPGTHSTSCIVVKIVLI